MSMQSSSLLWYPSISVCSMTPYAHVIDGKIFESMESYETFRETNVSPPSYNIGAGPNVTEMLHSIELMDANGTEHEIIPSKDMQNRETQFVHMVFCFI